MEAVSQCGRLRETHISVPRFQRSPPEEDRFTSRKYIFMTSVPPDADPNGQFLHRTSRYGWLYETKTILNTERATKSSGYAVGRTSMLQQTMIYTKK